MVTIPKREATPRRLWWYSANFGLVAVALASVASIPIPSPWWIPAWVALIILFTTLTGRYIIPLFLK